MGRAKQIYFGSIYVRISLKPKLELDMVCTDSILGIKRYESANQKKLLIESKQGLESCCDAIFDRPLAQASTNNILFGVALGAEHDVSIQVS